MADTKYGKYISRESYKVGSNPEVAQPMVHLDGMKHAAGENLTLSRSWITVPFTMIKAPHTHEFHQFLVYSGGNPLDVTEFGAEIELSLGEEGEKHIINTPAIVHIPPGLFHGPMSFVRIDKPIEFLDIVLAPEYIRK